MGCVTPSRLVSEKKNVKLSALTATTLHSLRIHSINGWNGIVWFVSCLNIIRMRAPVSAFASHVFRIQYSQRFIFTYRIFAIVNLLKQVFFLLYTETPYISVLDEKDLHYLLDDSIAMHFAFQCCTYS